MHVTGTNDAGETTVAAEVDGVANSSSADRLASRLLAAALAARRHHITASAETLTR